MTGKRVPGLRDQAQVNKNGRSRNGGHGKEGEAQFIRAENAAMVHGEGGLDDKGGERDAKRGRELLGDIGKGRSTADLAFAHVGVSQRIHARELQ